MHERRRRPFRPLRSPQGRRSSRVYKGSDQVLSESEGRRKERRTDPTVSVRPNTSARRSVGGEMGRYISNRESRTYKLSKNPNRVSTGSLSRRLSSRLNLLCAVKRWVHKSLSGTSGDYSLTARKKSRPTSTTTFFYPGSVRTTSLTTVCKTLVF